MFETSTAIEVENISKIYRLGMKDEMQDDFAKTIFEFTRLFFKAHIIPAERNRQ